MQEEKTVDKELKDFLDNKFSQVGEGFSKVWPVERQSSSLDDPV
jgi:hypothetical protein